MAHRKTVSLKDLVAKVNARNMNSTCAPAVRQGWNDLLETLLHDANVYAGFGYLTEKDVPRGEKPGIIYGEVGIVDNQYPDESRRFYYVHRHLG